MNERRVRVVVVEDSLVQRAHLVSLLEADGDIQVVGQATTATEAIDAVALNRPDVVTLDLHIPDGGGQYAIEQIMARTPTPILVLSATVGDDQSATAVEALVGGALVALPKPMSWTDGDEADLRRSVRCLQRVPVIRHPRGRLRAQTARLPETRRELVVGIAASTGGPAALATVLSGLAGLDAPVLVVQHLHADFTGGLATWMRRVSALPVEVAVHDQPLLPGHVYLSPGGVHLQLGSDRRIVLSRHPDGLHRPSADQLFLSMADRAGRDGIGVVLTGMGEDGARGLLALANRGGRIIGQDEATCAVFGMPRAANRLGAVQDLLPIDAIAGAIRRLGAERP